jgi:hypothetical protein
MVPGDDNVLAWDNGIPLYYPKYETLLFDGVVYVD